MRVASHRDEERPASGGDAGFEAAWPGRDRLGEGPCYDADGRRLLWVDYLGGAIRELNWIGEWRRGRTWELGRQVSAVVPRAGGGLLAIAAASVLELAEDGGLELLASIDEDRSAERRLNDAKCDPQGRLVAGWVAAAGSAPGGVCRVDADGQVETIGSDVGYANGLGWSPDGETFYLVDTLALCVYAYDYEPAGALADRRPIVSVQRGSGAPDGMTVDDEGCLWIAVPYAGEIRRHAPDGSLLEALATPTRMPTSCAFAGPDRDQLFVTSLSEGIRPGEDEGLEIAEELVEAALADRSAGRLFACRPGVGGPPARLFGAR